MQPALTLARSPDSHDDWFAADSLAVRGVAVSSALCRLVGRSNTTMPWFRLEATMEGIASKTGM